VSVASSKYDAIGNPFSIWNANESGALSMMQIEEMSRLWWWWWWWWGERDKERENVREQELNRRAPAAAFSPERIEVLDERCGGAKT
jgi:hypothetical protein